MSWEAHGIAFIAERDQGDDHRIHRLQVSFEQAGSAVFRTPLAEIPRPAGDGAVRVTGSVALGRYPFVDLVVNGFDVGIGLQSGAEWTSVMQHFDPSIEVRTLESNLTTGVAAIGRLRRWRRVQVEVEWVNGGVLVRTASRHSAAEEKTAHDWGVGWLTTFTVRADVRVSDAVAISASYFGSGCGRFVSHGASASGRHRWMMGVSYGR